MSQVMTKPDLSEPPVAPQGGGADASGVFVFPASYSQRRLWFLDRLMPDGWAYNIPSAYRLKGDLNVPALEKTFSEIVSRHEILRTTFKAVDGEPSQIISDAQPIRLPVIDLRALSPANRETELQRHISNELGRVFDLARGPLLTMNLLKLGDREHVLVKNVHHIISDSWSEEIFLSEWTSLYESFSQNKPSILDPLPIQYADYSEWQKQALQGEAMEQQTAYWKNQLGGEMPSLSLPTDHPRPATASLAGSAVKFTLPPSLTAALKTLGRQEEVTLFITLITAFKVLLHRYTAHTDIAVGTPITNRNRFELENLIGFFLNTLVLRTKFTGDLGFREILGRVREVTLGAFENQDLPFEVLVEKLQPERNLAQHPLCQVMFMLVRETKKLWESGGVTIEPLEIGQNSAKLDLVMSLFEKDDVIEGLLSYSTALFERETVERMTRQFQTLLESIVADPMRSIDDLQIQGDAERKQILIEWNDTAAPCSMIPVHELIAAQCARTPDATAITFENRSMTYGELFRHGQQLAAHLQSLGAQPGKLAGICIGRSPEMIVALLGILQSGAAYVPLDPEFPAARLEAMIEDAAPSIIITHRAVAGVLPKTDARIVYIEDELPTGAAFQPPQVSPADLAYVLFTSGSTGRPKGVEIPHRALTNLLESMRSRPGLCDSDTLLAVTTLSFDIAGLEIFLPLICGAKIVLAGSETAMDPRRLATILAKDGVTVMQATPATWRGLLVAGWQGTPGLKILCGGEAMPPDLAEQLLPRCSSLWNVYGPTETTIWSTVEKVESAAKPVTLGRPIANTRIYILNERQHPQPIGIYGELHIGGLGVANGYLGRPELTAQKFIADPFGAPGERLYKTGDLVRYHTDGSIEFFGRIDQQVKVRGFRIELAEIESALGRHPAVRQCVVTVREDQPGDKRLVAYIVREGEADDAALRAFLKKKLPDYMVPSAFVFLDAFPMTPNGKVDRKALPALDRSLSPQHEFVAPRTPLEQQLAAIWIRVLGMEKIGIHDDFFELGGHSLMAVSLFSEIEKKMGRNLPLATLFQAPTIGQLAEVIQQEGWSAPWSPLVVIQPRGTREPFFCIHGADGPVLFYSKLASLLGETQPVYGLQAQGLDGGQIQHSSMEAMAKLYIKEIRTVQPRGPYFLGGYSFGGLLALEIAQQFHAQGEKIALVAMFDANNYMVRPRRYTLRERIALRSRAIARMSLAGKLAFIFDRGIRKLSVIILVNKERLQKLAYKILSKRKEVVAPNYRALHVRETNDQAMRDYRPRLYPGKLTLFRAENPNEGYEFDSQLGWGGLATEGLEIHDVPGEHETIFKEPNVQILAAAMRECIEKARKAPTFK